MKALLIALAAATAAIAAPATAAQSSSPAARDWSQVVEVTPEGGYRMGNPDAPVKIVEYVSLTCSHCAHFAEEGLPKLVDDYVRTGKASLEYRNYVLNAYDLAAAFISRCAAPRDYFRLSSDILGRREEWVGRVASLPASERQQLQSLPLIEGLQRIVAMTGLDAIAARHNVTPANARLCLSDQAGLSRIEALRKAGDAAGVTGTPTFAINGTLSSASDWATLEPLLKAAR